MRYSRAHVHGEVPARALASVAADDEDLLLGLAVLLLVELHQRRRVVRARVRRRASHLGIAPLPRLDVEDVRGVEAAALAQAAEDEDRAAVGQQRRLRYTQTQERRLLGVRPRLSDRSWRQAAATKAAAAAAVAAAAAAAMAEAEVATANVAATLAAPDASR